MRSPLECYDDHLGLWADELGAWVPDAILDAHVHIGPPEAVGPIRPARLRQAVTTYTSMAWEQLVDLYAELYSGKTVSACLAFPFPQREVELETANDYLIETMARVPRLQGCLLADPVDTARVVQAFNRAQVAGVRFAGVKPYADRLGKSNFEAKMTEFIHQDLLEFMNAERLIMMLHTPGSGAADRDNQAFLRNVAHSYPQIKVVLAHMGRYIEPWQFHSFVDSGILTDCPTLYLEMSSASSAEVYRRVLEDERLWNRLLFGSDLPFGLITGVERWSESRGAIFLTRDDYGWSDPEMNAEFARQREQLTYNTYHCIKALKDAVEEVKMTAADAHRVRNKVFRENALSLLYDP